MEEQSFLDTFYVEVFCEMPDNSFFRKLESLAKGSISYDHAYEKVNMSYGFCFKSSEDFVALNSVASFIRKIYDKRNGLREKICNIEMWI